LLPALSSRGDEWKIAQDKRSAVLGKPNKEMKLAGGPGPMIGPNHVEGAPGPSLLGTGDIQFAPSSRIT
jgi:hypothetical protein